MARAARIMEILQDMIHIDSETNTLKERQMEGYLQQFFSHLDGVVSGLIHVPDDNCQRSVVYGLVRGSTAHTVIFMNHHDVVDVESYGYLRDQALTRKGSTRRWNGRRSVRKCAVTGKAANGSLAAVPVT